MTEGSTRKPVSLFALGVALSVELIVGYLVCALAAVAFPKVPLAHGRLQLFSSAPEVSLGSVVTGICGSLILAWVSAVIFTPVYNRLAAD